MKPFCAPQDKVALPCESQHQTFSNAQEVDRVPWALFSLIGVFVVAEQATYPSSFFFFFTPGPAKRKHRVSNQSSTPSMRITRWI